MALRPRTVNFDETWQKISSTVDAVICLKKVTKNDWNERFSYPFLLHF
jgi:cullin 2